MKRIIALLITTVMVLSVFSGCGDGRVKFSSEKEMRTRFEGVYEFVDDVYIINGDTMLEITNIEDLIDVENIDSFLENELKDVDINADLELNEYVQFFPYNTKEYEITYDLENNQISYNDRYIIAVDNTGIQTDTGEIAYKNDYFAFSIDLRKDFADFLLALYGAASNNDCGFSLDDLFNRIIKEYKQIARWKKIEKGVYTDTGSTTKYGGSLIHSENQVLFALSNIGDATSDYNKILIRATKDGSIQITDSTVGMDIDSALGYYELAIGEETELLSAEDIKARYTEESYDFKGNTMLDITEGGYDYNIIMTNAKCILMISPVD